MLDKVLFENSRLRVIDRNGYIFTHTKNSAIYLLPYRRPQIDAYLLVRFEVCPAHTPHKKEVCAITGQCGPNDDPLAIAILELHEECGIFAQPSQFVSLGSGYLTKQADTLAHLFTIDITDMPRGKAPSDGSLFEQESYCDWYSRIAALSASCIGLQALIFRAEAAIQAQ